jgi:ABC-2 type transport system ATP-binding protein
MINEVFAARSYIGVGMNALEIQSLSKTFRGKKRVRVEALKGVSLSVAQGEVFGFLGPNGAGKSTTIKTIMGLIRPSSGEAFVMGHPTGSMLARKQVGYLPENPAFYDFLTAEEYLDFVGNIYGVPKELLERRKGEVLALLELTEARKRPMRTYSKGMVQRLGLAQVLLHNPDVYILDEPMSGLDPLGRALVKNIILDLKKQGKCVFFSTHITADVESICDRVGIILKGELKRVDKVDTIMTEGIRGYQVRIRSGKTGASMEHQVGVEQLSAFLAREQEAGNDITLVEPQRTNLEEFFLQIVKGA